MHIKPLLYILGQSGGSYMDENDTSGMLNDSSILNTSVNFNVGNLKEMLKCISCHRFLFPPILQCAQGHMSCKSCFEIKGKRYLLSFYSKHLAKIVIINDFHLILIIFYNLHFTNVRYRLIKQHAVT